jgi:hypothetical protein
VAAVRYARRSASRRAVAEFFKCFMLGFLAGNAHPISKRRYELN